MSKWLKLVLFCLVLFIMVGMLSVGILSDKQHSANITVNQMPSFELTTLAQLPKPISLLQLPTENYYLLNVWASWCAICRTEHDFLIDLQQQDIAIIGLNYRDKHANALQYLTQLGDPYQDVIFDPKGKLALNLGVIGTPETYLIAPNGEIIKKISGVVTQSLWRDELESYFDD